jgi:hypothetical protein
MPTRHLTILLLALSAAASARCDEVTLTDGTVVKGKITMETDVKVVLQRDSGRVVLSRDQVASIEKTPFTFATHVPGAPAAPSQALAAPKADPKPDIGTWPPRTGASYPDLTLLDCNGNLFKLSSLKGKVILVEPVGMSCTACQALSGGHACGGFLGVEPQPGISSLDENLARFGGGLTLDNPNIAYVQVVIFNLDLKAPSVTEVKAWADHFKLTGRPNVYVLVGTPAMLTQASFDMIPGVHLVDRGFVLRSEHFGHGGGSDLYRELLPMTATLVAASN